MFLNHLMTRYRITHVWQHNLLSCMGVLCLMASSCTSDSVIEEIKEIKTDNNPMRFTSVGEGAVESSSTRSSVLLEDGFSVSCWKNFGDVTKQQDVMIKYKVEYNASAADKWSYENVSGQILRYWDFGAFPYEFRACTPYISPTIFNPSPKGLSLDFTSASNWFKAQTFLDGATALVPVLSESEPCMVAHVSRVVNNEEYIDTDLITTTEINETAKSNATRSVALPFHHLMSKVGFRFYIDDPTVPSYAISLSDVEISVISATTDGKVVTECKQYSATNEQGLNKGTFASSATTDKHTLLSKADAYTEDMANHLNKNSAFDFKLPDDMVQIPQENLKIHVKLSLTHNGTKDTFDTMLSLDGTNSTGDTFTWLPNTHYVYYLHLQNLEQYPIIVCTAEVVPWEIVKTEDINIGL